MTQGPYKIVYEPEITAHFAVIERKWHSLILRTILGQLSHQPDVKTRNRKPLEQPSAFEGAWELRFGPDNRFRVFYRPDPVGRAVRVLAVGWKEGDRLFVGREEFLL